MILSICLFSCILRNAFSALVRWTSLYSGSGFCSLCSSVVAAVLMCSTTLLRSLLFFFFLIPEVFLNLRRVFETLS
uniref:Secreted protein n=1 Tax=Ixodes ricinus TaxID=34613 RepID=A0A6B0U2G2_IXORI